MAAVVYQDFRAAGAQKRPRTDGAGGEGDWVCPNCGNNNFSFRSTCNMRKCGASRPTAGSDLLQRTVIAPPLYDPLQPSQFISASTSPVIPNFPASAYGAPQYLAQPAQFVGQLAPQPLAVSYVPGPGYGVPTAASPPPSMLPGTVVPGGGYGGAPIDGTGMAGRMMMAARGQPMYTEDVSRKRRGGPDSQVDGDWVCPNCGNNNFAFRTSCNMRKCGTAKPAAAKTSFQRPEVSAARQQDGTAPDGSWTCKQCGNVNYPFRTKCNRRNCGAERTDGELPQDLGVEEAQ
eukprot:TRINITY_DN8225_c0_g1_i1.p1 TRINITY_DN8225_c0_g1~~TRINITY_DN8225_c0_g1_i1.p1  ORF type:complete len:289 (-),score=40.98 TRINITY_DN8225_c0_g1_i1:1392-2258(-)